MNLVGSLPVSSRWIMTTEVPTSVAPQNSGPNPDLELVHFMPIWNGILHEFRNHLTVLLAAATEVRAVAPPALTAELADALVQSEVSVERMNCLVAFVDAAVRNGAPVLADLDDVIEQALRLAAPALGRTSVSFTKPRALRVPNRGTALECLISGLIVELSRADAQARLTGRRHQIEVHAEIGDDATLLAIESNGRAPAPGAWRVALAADLASRIGATLVAHEPAGFVVRLP
jgi:hypothetical protein